MPPGSGTGLLVLLDALRHHLRVVRQLEDDRVARSHGPSPRTTTVSRKICSSSPAVCGCTAPWPEITPRRNQRGPSTPTNRTTWKPPVPSGSCTGTCARSSQPERALDLVDDAALLGDAGGDLLADLAPDALALGRGEGLQLDRAVPSTTVAATIASPATSTRSSMPSTPGTKMPPRSTRPSPGSRTSELSHGPSGRGARLEPYALALRLVRPRRPPATPSTTCSASRRRVLGGTLLLATSEHVTVLPGRIRPKRIDSHPLPSPDPATAA